MKEDEGEDQRAFVVVRSKGETWVSDVPANGDPYRVGSDGGCELVLSDAGVAPTQCTLWWNGTTMKFRSEADGTFLAGKRFEGDAELKPGDELAFGGAQLVVGVAAPLTAGGRRSLTHHEFRERLYEETARAARGGRPTALVMIAGKTGEGGRIANTALDSFRAGDVVGTYASDELEFLLPDTDGETAATVVSRILASAQIEAAVGLAVAPAHGETPERLIRAAREALTDAQRSGNTIAEPPPRTRGGDVLVAIDATTSSIVSELEDAAADRAPVLLIGEKSAGKSVFARLLHERSDQKEGPFVTVHCASLTPGAVSGIFGASGAASAAKDGTLFLDEVGELSVEGQQAVVRWFDEDSPKPRVVATTHRALAGLVERGAFDTQLHELLTTHVIEIPPLRNRADDILPLAERFAVDYGASQPVKFSPGAIARLRSYPWPGNILELRNAMERAVRLARESEILAEHLPSEPMPIEGGAGRLREHVDSVERDAIIKALADSNNNQTHAAKRLGISRRALIYKMEKYGLKRPPKGAAKR